LNHFYNNCNTSRTTPDEILHHQIREDDPYACGFGRGYARGYAYDGRDVCDCHLQAWWYLQSCSSCQEEVLVDSLVKNLRN
jgi:hypothetical protein